MKKLLIMLGMLIGSVAHAATGQFAGLNLEQGNSLQLQLCSLKPGKSMADYAKVVDAYFAWSKANNVETTFLRATPMFASPPQGETELGFDFIEMLFSPFDVAGRGWTQWLTTDEGRKLNAQWQAAANCRVSISAAFINVIDPAALSATNDRVMVLNWCTRREGVSVDQLVAKHQQIASGWTPEAPLKAWATVYPSLGSRNTPGEFAHLLMFTDANGLMAYQNGLANNEGWRNRLDYETSYAECVGDNVYYGQVLHRVGG